MATSLHTLVIGGTARARRLASRLARHQRITYSLAGVTAQPRLPEGCAIRRGPFGGVAGLTAYLRQHGIDRVLDGSHPHAHDISKNVQQACAETAVPLLQLQWRPWRAHTADNWRHFKSTTALCTALRDREPSRVFLALGVKASAPVLTVSGHHYLLRCVEPPHPSVLHSAADVVLARGPFDELAEKRLLEQHGIDLIVCKNSGLPQGRAKLNAARQLGIAVWLVDARFT